MGFPGTPSLYGQSPSTVPPSLGKPLLIAVQILEQMLVIV
jgi:hypothetical protein